MNKKCVIVSGGTIQEEFALQTIKDIRPDYIIGVDSGLNFLYRTKIEPTHIVGDFDSVDELIISHYKKHAHVPIREYNAVKDSTDTEIALYLALELEVDEIWLLGATGTRLDHVWANVQILKIALDHNVKTYMVDECNRISLWKDSIRLSKKTSFGKYFSIFPFGGSVEDVSIEGAKYSLEHYKMAPFESRTVSNEYADDEVVITFPKGIVLLMETRDQ